MTVGERIARIRLLEKINKNPEYATRIGIYIENEKTNKNQASVANNS